MMNIKINRMILDDIKKLIVKQLETDSNRIYINKRKLFSLFRDEYLLKYQKNDFFTISFNRFNDILHSSDLLSKRFKNKKRYKNYIILVNKIE